LKTCKRITVFIIALLSVGSISFFAVTNGLAAERELVRRGAAFTDTETGLVWPVDADSPSFKSCSSGLKTWQQAMEYVNCLNVNGYLGYRDWRLPSPDEFMTLYNSPEKNARKKLAWLKLKEHGFKIDKPHSYWSSVAPTDEVALAVDVLAGGCANIHPLGRMSVIGVWPVRGGK